MGRPREFDREAVLDTAIEVFTRQGYEATSIQDLVEQMGIHRASLYDTFGDKHTLYLAALDRYDARNFATKCALLSSCASKKEAYRLFYGNIIDELMSTRGVSFGCFITNSSVERAAIDPESATRAAANWNRFIALHFETLCEARARGEIDPSKTDDDLRAIARFLGSTAKGLRVTAKSECRRETLEDIARVALSVLDH
jgi:TetR/AcrR family transcriptional repressor of nem operon